MSKITGMPPNTAPIGTDVIEMVDDPGGTPENNQVTFANVTKALSVMVGDSGSGGTKGLVPAPGAGDAAAGKFLKADGSFAVPPGVGGPATQIEESSGPTTLDIGAIVDGEFLKRVGTEIVSDSVPGGAEAGANSDITSMDGLTGALETPTRIDFAEGAAPGTPGAAKVSLYAKADGLLYSKDDAGAETLVSGGAGGGSIAPLVVESANVVAQRNGATGQTFNIYSSFTDASNYDRLRLGFNSPNMEISVEKAGTGTQRSLSIKVGSTFLLFDGSRLYPSNNKTMDLGFPSGNWFGAGNFNECRVSSSVRWENGLKVTEGGTGSGNNNILKIAGDFRGGGTFSGGNETASQFTANQNNLSVLGYYMQRWSSDASRDVTGMTAAGNVAEMVLLIVNVGSNDIVLKHENASSTAANRFLCSTGADITLSANQAAEAIYDSTSQRWRIFKRN